MGGRTSGGARGEVAGEGGEREKAGGRRKGVGYCKRVHLAEGKKGLEDGSAEGIPVRRGQENSRRLTQNWEQTEDAQRSETECKRL